MVTQLVGVHYAGATSAHKLRPVDVLEQILRESRGGKLEQFFALYGAPEASAMCYFLATAKDRNEVELCAWIYPIWPALPHEHPLLSVSISASSAEHHHITSCFHYNLCL